MGSLIRFILVCLGITIAVTASDGWETEKASPVNWKSKREAIGTYYINLLMFIDYKIYNKFYKRATGITTTERVKQAESEIKKYYTLYAKSMNSIYSGINSSKMKIKISLMDIIISKEPETWIKFDILGRLATGNILDSFHSHLQNYQYGHAMWITAHEIIGSNNEMVAGRAEVNSICQVNKKSVSVIEDRGRFQSVRTACHELAHSLGAGHDTTEPGCLESDQYIMAGTTTNVNINKRWNPWRFSGCSVKAIEETIKDILTLSSQEQQCLTRKMSSNINQTLFENFHAGQVYTPDQQCQMIRGSNSYFIRDGTNGANICTNMKCGDGKEYSNYTAAEGTSCGSKKWCQLGRCISSEKAPSKPEKCVFGDIPAQFKQIIEVINGGSTDRREMSCSEIVQSFSILCKNNKNIASRCCSSCGEIATSNNGCEYGDEIQGCLKSRCDEVYPSGYIPAKVCCGTCNLELPFVCRDQSADCSVHVSGGADICYDVKFAFRCCKTCARVRNSKRTGCEYGDRIKNCYKQHCNYYKDQCCETCNQDVTSSGHRSIGAPSYWFLLVMIGCIQLTYTHLNLS